MDFVVGEEGAVIANSELVEFNTLGLFGHFYGFGLLAHALFGSAGGVAYFEATREMLIGISVNTRDVHNN